MDELIVLGTGNALVTNVYNTCFALRCEEEYLLVDAGGGNTILNHLEKAHIDLNHIHHMFVSHAHTDHILGTIWVIRMIATAINKGSYQGYFHIYGHKEVIDDMKTICKITLTNKLVSLFDDCIIFHELEDGDSMNILWHTFTFFDIHSTKLKQFGFYYYDHDLKYTFCGDEPYNELCYNYVKDSYLLMHEAFCLYSDKDRYDPYKKHHSTVKDAAMLASKLGVSKLILWHSEYDDLIHHQDKYIKEAKQYFNQEVYVPKDLDRIELK